MRDIIRMLALRWAVVRLARAKRTQQEMFPLLQREFCDKYQGLKGRNIEHFISPTWRTNNDQLERAFKAGPPFGFLNISTIKDAMFVDAGGRWLETELSFLERRLPRARLKSLLKEDWVGQPPLRSATYMTSHNSIHHLYHILRFVELTGCDVGEIEAVVEWGGGYGNLAKLFKRLSSPSCTYVIVDTPLFSVLQWLYLTTVLGRDRVNLIGQPGETIQPGRINLVPLCYIDEQSLDAELFISTWALSESSRYCQDYVETRNWFGARRLLFAYQDNSEAFPHAERLGRVAAAHGAIIDDIECLPANHYAFR